MCRSFYVVAMVASLFQASAGQAEITCVQVAGDLYVTGTKNADNFAVAMWWDGSTQVVDYLTGENKWFDDVSAVWVSAGKGDDYVEYVCDGRFSWKSIDIDMGKGSDTVKSLFVYQAGVQICTGNGDDVCYEEGIIYSDVTIDTSGGNDDVYLDVYGCPLDVQLDNGDDTIVGKATGCLGTIDGGTGLDDRSGLTVEGGDLDVINCEY